MVEGMACWKKIRKQHRVLGSTVQYSTVVVRSTPYKLLLPVQDVMVYQGKERGLKDGTGWDGQADQHRWGREQVVRPVP